VAAEIQAAPATPPKFTSPPGPEESPEIKALIDRTTALLSSGKDTGAVLVDPVFLPAHEWPRFRRLIRDHARSSVVTIVTPEEPGVPLLVTGRVTEPSGRTVKGARLYVYQTSAQGWYSDRAAHIAAQEGDRKHARLFGYILTDDEGHFVLRTVRPAGYPQSNLPAHIHVEVETPDARGVRLTTEINFDDDPRLSGAMRRRAERERFVICRVTRGADGGQRVDAELKLPAPG
jgi:protocatechuate 3,4-dioxygenase beta subunit